MSMSSAHDQSSHQRAQELAHLQEDFPGFQIWQEITGERIRLVAIRRYHGISPHTVITAEAAELRTALSGPQPTTTSR